MNRLVFRPSSGHTQRNMAFVLEAYLTSAKMLVQMKLNTAATTKTVDAYGDRARPGAAVELKLAWRACCTMSH